jgi:hypothetical protein
MIYRGISMPLLKRMRMPVKHGTTQFLGDYYRGGDDDIAGRGESTITVGGTNVASTIEGAAYHRGDRL